MREYLNRVICTLSQTVNVIVLNGDVGETIASRAYRERWKVRPYIDRFCGLFNDEFHCMESYLEHRIAARRFLEMNLKSEEKS